MGGKQRALNEVTLYEVENFTKRFGMCERLELAVKYIVYYSLNRNSLLGKDSLRFAIKELSKESTQNRSVEFTKFLKKLRVDHGETQRDMATRIGICPSILSRIEVHHDCVPVDFFERVCDAYSLTPEKANEFKQTF